MEKIIYHDYVLSIGWFMHTQFGLNLCPHMAATLTQLGWSWGMSWGVGCVNTLAFRINLPQLCVCRYEIYDTA
jgi:hypothetical protein